MRAVIASASAIRHVLAVGTQALLIAAIVAVIALVLATVYRPADSIVGSVDAGQAGKITVPDGVFAGTTTATVNPGGADVWAKAMCFQGGVKVYEQYQLVGGDNRATFTLGPTPSWSGGSADCVGQEGTFGRNNRWKVVAETTFRAID